MADTLATGLINRLANGGMVLCPNGTETVSDQGTAFVCYTILTQTGSVQVSQLTTPTPGLANAMRITQTQATAQRFGVQQTIARANCADLRTSFINTQHQAKFSQSARTMFALLEWTGTADAAPVDVVADWTSALYVPGQFFVSSVNVLNYGYLSATADSWAAAPYIPYQAGASTNNLIYFIWTETAVEQNGTLDLSLVQVARGTFEQEFEYRPKNIDAIDLGIIPDDVIIEGDLTVDGNVTAHAFIPDGATVPTNGMYLPAANTIGWSINSAAEIKLDSTALYPATTGGSALGNSTNRFASLQTSTSVTALPPDAGAGTYSVNLNRVTSDNFDAIAAGAQFVIQHQDRAIFGGSNCTGGRIAHYDFIANTLATASGNTNRNYVANNMVAYTAVGDGGTNPTSGSKGAYFPIGTQGFLDIGATNVFALTSEFDSYTASGSSVNHLAPLSLVCGHAVRGSGVDAFLWMSGTGAVGNFGPHIGSNFGILFTDINGANPFYPSSVIIGSYWTGATPTIATGIDLTGFTISGNAWQSSNASISGAGVGTFASVTSPGALTAYNATAIPAGGTTGSGIRVSSTSNFGIFFGSGAPTLSAAKGSLYLRSDGSGTNDRMYVNTNGSTTWTAVTTVA